MFEKKLKKQPMVFRPTVEEDQAIRFIAKNYKVSLSDVIHQLLTDKMCLEEMLHEAKKITAEVNKQSN